MTTITMPAKTENLGLALEFLEANLRLQGFDGKSVLQVDVAAEEIFVNICHYAYGGKEGDMEIRFSMTPDGGKAVIEFRDDGRPFNPLTAGKPDISAPPQDREEGGLGIFMAKKMTSSMEYRYEANRNILTITKQKGDTEHEN